MQSMAKDKEFGRCLILLFATLFGVHSLHGQNTFRAVVKDKVTHEFLGGVTVSAADNTKAATTSDGRGVVSLKGLSDGPATIHFSFIGYKPFEISTTIPDTVQHAIYLEQDEKVLQQVTVVSSTRNNDPVESATTKVEVLGIEDMNEESTLKPGNIASIIGDMSGIQIQQSSVATGNANVRIQGLEGKYTQILRDGMPLFEGYSGGFGILSIPPLDLKQIELIKGSASTLYGGGAIGGLINLISKKPSLRPDASFLINQTTLKETNFNAYYAHRGNKVGLTFFAGQNFQKAVDVDKDGFSDLPDTKALILHPTFFIYPSATSQVSLGWSGNFEKRIGGDMIAVSGKKDATHPYFEENKIGRNTFSLISENRFNSITATMKASLSIFDRDQLTNSYVFKAKQNNFYSELSLLAHITKHVLVAGINLTGDAFKPAAATPAPIGSFSNTTQGVFTQDTWKLLEGTKLETGLRVDHHNDYGTFVLPRVALFHHINENWGTRLGFGMGYKTPNPLTAQVRDYDIYNILPLSASVKAEQSTGANFELNYKKEFGDNSFFINHAFFITNINKPIVAIEDALGKLNFVNQPKPVLTQGFDTYIQMELYGLELYLGYTFTSANRKYLSQNQFALLTPQHRAASVIAYEIEHQWRFGIEASYTGWQHREDYSKTPGYLFMAAMLEKKFGAKWGRRPQLRKPVRCTSE